MTNKTVPVLETERLILLTEKSNATAKSFYENDGWTCADYDLYTFFYG